MNATRVSRLETEVDGLGLLTVCGDDLWVCTSEGVMKAAHLGAGEPVLVASVRPSAPIVSTRGGRVAALVNGSCVMLQGEAAPAHTSLGRQVPVPNVGAIGAAGPWLLMVRRVLSADGGATDMALLRSDLGLDLTFPLRSACSSAHRYAIPLGDAAFALSTVETPDDKWTEVVDTQARSVRLLEGVTAWCEAPGGALLGQVDELTVLVFPGLEPRAWSPIEESWEDLPPFSWQEAGVAMRTASGHLAVVAEGRAPRWVRRSGTGLEVVSGRPPVGEFADLVHMQVSSCSEGGLAVVLLAPGLVEVFMVRH